MLLVVVLSQSFKLSAITPSLLSDTHVVVGTFSLLCEEHLIRSFWLDDRTDYKRNQRCRISFWRWLEKSCEACS